jgi:ADP-ribose pyrophosphatase YjhB (NUDIX family)
MKHLEAKKKENISSFKFSDEVYARILDSIAVACGDSILVCGDELLLAKRNIEPRADHWAIIGGRMIAGERPEETARRRLFQETGLQIDDLSRFEFSEVYSAYYPIRAQAPANNGSHTINFTFIVKISPAEKAKINLTKSEYQDFRWISVDKVMDFLRQEKEDVYIENIIGDAVKYLKKL